MLIGLPGPFNLLILISEFNPKNNKSQPKLLKIHLHVKGTIKEFQQDIQSELANHKELIGQIKNDKYQEFKDNLYELLKEDKGIFVSSCIKEALASVGVAKQLNHAKKAPPKSTYLAKASMER